jgi:hypothetical protein
MTSINDLVLSYYRHLLPLRAFISNQIGSDKMHRGRELFDIDKDTPTPNDAS